MSELGIPLFLLLVALCFSWDASCYSEGKVAEIGKSCNMLIMYKFFKKLIHNLSMYAF